MKTFALKHYKTNLIRGTISSYSYFGLPLFNVTIKAYIKI